MCPMLRPVNEYCIDGAIDSWGTFTNYISTLLNPIKLFMNILKYSKRIYSLMTTMVSDIKIDKFREAGYHGGQLCYYVLFTKY